MCRLFIAFLSTPQSIFMVCDGVFEMMNDSSTTFGSPSRCSISLIVLVKLDLRIVRADVPDALGIDEDHMLSITLTAATG